MRIILNNLVIGNQIIVRSSEVDIGTSIVLLLTQVLPKRCVSLILNSNTYQEAYAANLLSIQPGVVVPQHVPSNSYVLITATRTDVTGSDDDEEIHLVVNGCLPGRSKDIPCYVTSLMKALTESNNAETFDQWLLTLRESWLRHAKTYFLMSRSQLSVAQDDAARAKSLGLRARDVPLLRFWGQGLSREHRAKLLRLAQRSE
eukprot:TRINITY_DN8746_c0_g1_i1.p2 TRINITY_DN8746_c0_g1~~TRINITY_DN8746_c0_g1_i1.p2  ORF type:complete len:202 (+),score=45.91 TRINITY_DN8746_c0_g1_i1:961-1566(+)